MKIQILNTQGKKIKEITTNLFEEPIRQDIILKVVEAEKLWQPYSSKYRAGMNRSASGLTRKRRHVWKSDRGRGLSRIPRKIFWRRGTQFSWEGAIVPGTRGGRKAHPPKGSVNLKKINKKEYLKALLSALTYTSKVEELKKKYSSLANKEINIKLPLIIDNKLLTLKTKEFVGTLKKILGPLFEIAVQKKSVRAGKGKMRGRKYKKTAGLLLVTGKDENKTIKGIESVPANLLTVSDLASNGARLTVFTENAIKELEKLTEEKSKRNLLKDKKVKQVSESKEEKSQESKKKEKLSSIEVNNKLNKEEQK